MSETTAPRTVDLGTVDPAGSRHAGRRSAVALTDDLIVVGRADGSVVAHDRATLETRWRADCDRPNTSIVSARQFGDVVVVGERGPAGAVRWHDADSGTRRSVYETRTDVGDPQQQSRFFYPFVVDLASDGERLYVVARRYERDGDQRSFTSRIYAFDDAGETVWTVATDASPISLALRDERLAVAYNRCPGSHQQGLVVHDVTDGRVRWQWDPGTEGQRRVGDVTLLAGGAIVASHGDYRGYRLANDGTTQWRVDLATKQAIDGETVYAYPNHVHATDDGAVFVTGNTYPEDGRETAARHPREHTAIGVDATGAPTWATAVGGFASDIATDGGRLAVPGAQNFRERDPDDHGVCVLDVVAGAVDADPMAGVPTAVAVRGDTVCWIEEPIVYHDEGTEHGRYRLHQSVVE